MGGFCFGGPYNKDYGIFGSILGSSIPLRKRYDHDGPIYDPPLGSLDYCSYGNRSATLVYMSQPDCLISCRALKFLPVDHRCPYLTEKNWIRHMLRLEGAIHPSFGGNPQRNADIPHPIVRMAAKPTAHIDDGKSNGSCCGRSGEYKENGKSNGHYCSILNLARLACCSLTQSFASVCH